MRFSAKVQTTTKQTNIHSSSFNVLTSTDASLTKHFYLEKIFIIKIW